MARRQLGEHRPLSDSRVPFHRRPNYHPSGVSEAAYGRSQRVPFPTERYATTNLYLRLRNLEIRPPRHYSIDFLRRLPIWDTLRGYIDCLGLMRLITHVWDGHESLCIEMCSSFRLELNDEGELCMYCMFRGELWEITRQVMHDAFGFYVGDDLSQFVPADFDVASAWYSLSGASNYRTSGVPSAFIRDDALLILHRFLSCMISGKKEISKVNAMEIYLLTCARDNVRVCMAPFIWSQLSNVQNKRGAHPTLSYIATGLARHLGVDISQSAGLTLSQEISPTELLNAHLLRGPTEFIPYRERRSVVAYHASRRRGQGNEESEDEEHEYEEGGDEEDEGHEGHGGREDAHVPPDEDLLVHHYSRRDRIRARQALEAEVPPYWAEFRTDFTHFQQEVFHRFDSLSTRVSNIEQHLTRYTDFSVGSSSTQPDPNDPRFWAPNDPRFQDPRYQGPFDP